MTIEIPLTQGLVALIDEADFDLVSRFKWCAFNGSTGKTYYAQSHIRRDNGSRTNVYMHRLLFGLTDSRTDVDHIDGDGLNNRRANLRTCSRAENLWNRGAQANNKSGFKGVTFHKQSRKWRAEIRFNGNYKSLGYFHTPEEAHMAYCAAAAELHGEFCNFGAMESGQKKGPEGP